MRIEQTFTLNASPAHVWKFLSDPLQVAACLPGAKITARIDEQTYEGTLTVRIGPVSATYTGQVRVERLDARRLEAEIRAHGQGLLGRGGAEMRMVSRLVPLADGGTEVRVESDVAITGTLAQMGRGMIESLSAQMLRQFTAAMKQRLDAAGSGPGA